MPIPIYDAPSYARQLAGHLPNGRAWPKDSDSFLMSVMGWLSPTFARNHARAAYLLTDAFPTTTSELLPEWEATLGLPDPCAGTSPTVVQRRAQVVARFLGNGGQTPAYFIGFAANLGYVIGITQYAPARFGVSAFGAPYLGKDWANVWTINAPLQTVVIAQYGLAHFGEPYQSSGNAVLECEMDSIKPAHTVLLFHYS